jgi:hypothetical protein
MNALIQYVKTTIQFVDRDMQQAPSHTIPVARSGTLDISDAPKGNYQSNSIVASVRVEVTGNLN